MTDLQQTNPSLVNTVRSGDVYTAICNALGDSKDFLKQFCGPYALHAATIASSGSVMVDEFTKDGVSIYSHLSARTSTEETARRLIEFIGKQVDRRCHDGTTTSMMTASALGYHWMSSLKDQDRRSRYTASKTISDITATMISAIEDQSFTVDELISAVKNKYPEADVDSIRLRILYDTIMTASKGDTDLAEKLSEVLDSLPPELYGYARFENNNCESDERYVVKTQMSDIQLRGDYVGDRFVTPGNRHLGSSFSIQECDLVVSGNPMLDGQPESDYTVQWIINQLLPTKTKTPKEVPVLDKTTGEQILDPMGNPQVEVVQEDVITPAPTQLTRPLVIIAPRLESRINHAVNLYNDSVTDWNKKIFIFSYHQNGSESYSAVARAIAVMSGETDGQYLTLLEAVNAHDFTRAMIPCKFEHSGVLMDIYNLYKRDGRKFHPAYYNKSRTKYNALLEEMKETVGHYKQGAPDPTRRMEKFVHDLVYLERCMICQRILELRVCGSQHELMANRTVVEDAMGSALSILEDGVVLSGYQKVLKAITELQEQYPLLKGTEDGLEEVIMATFSITDKEFEASRSTLVDFDNKEDIKYLYINAKDEKFTPRDALAELANDDSECIFQPKAGYIEQFTRISDIISKLVTTYAVLNVRQFDPSVGR